MSENINQIVVQTTETTGKRLIIQCGIENDDSQEITQQVIVNYDDLSAAEKVVYNDFFNLAESKIPV